MEAKKRLLKKIIIILRIIVVLEIICIVGFFVVDISSSNCHDNLKRTMSEQMEIDSSNSMWKDYVGENKTENEVRTLISAVIARNASMKNSGYNRFIKLNGLTDTEELSKEMKEKYYNKEEKKYSIKPVYKNNDTTDYITELIITEEAE